MRRSRSLTWLLVLLPCLASVASVACGSSHPAASADDGGAEDAASEPAAPYTQTLLSNAPIGSDSSKPDFQKATASVQLTGGPFANVNLVVDLVSPCFPFSNWTTDPPPSGQSWPADCDAFDRNFEMSLVDPSDASATPGLELIRAITPFGGPEHLEQDVTDAFNAIQGPRTFQVVIPTYSDSAGKVSGSNGGWIVSAHLDVTPGTPPANVLAVIPLFYGSVTAGEGVPGPDAGGASTDGGEANATVADIPFTMPPGTTSSHIEYRVTGHGGASDPSASCIGPAEEFCQRVHHAYLDDQQIEQVTPWRNNCSSLCTVTTGGPFGSYCAQNPCGAPASVRASRANWCPGSETPPYKWTPAALSTPGAHSFRFAIDDMYPGGEWRVSATVYAYGD